MADIEEGATIYEPIKTVFKNRLDAEGEISMKGFPRIRMWFIYSQPDSARERREWAHVTRRPRPCLEINRCAARRPQGDSEKANVNMRMVSLGNNSGIIFHSVCILLLLAVSLTYFRYYLFFYLETLDLLQVSYGSIGCWTRQGHIEDIL